MATYVKANNTTALNLTGSWTTGVVPTSADIGQWNSTVTGANTVALGGAMSWLGVSITNPGGAVTVGTTTATWTIGSSGIDMSAATQNLTINSPVSVALGANQAWNVASGRTLTVSAALTGSGTLTKSGSGDLQLIGSTGANTGTVTISAGVVYLGSLGSGFPDQLQSANIVNNAVLYIRGSLNYNIDKNITGTGDWYVRNTNSGGAGFGIQLLGTSYTGSARVYADASEGSNPSQIVAFTSSSQIGISNFYFLSNSGPTTVTQMFAYRGNTTLSATFPFFVYPLGGTHTNKAIVANQGSTGTAASFLNVVQNLGAITSTFEVQATNGPVTFSAGITENSTGTLNLFKTGSYALTLSGANTYKGSVTVSAGTLNANSTTALGVASSTAGISVTGGATLSLGAALNYSSPGRSTSIGGYGVGFSGALIHAFAGTANVGTISCGSTTYVRATQTGTLSSGIVTSGVSDVIVGVDSNRTLTLSGGISGTGRLVVGRSVSDAGTVYLSTSNSYAGVTSLEYGTLLLGNNNALGTSGGLTFSGNPTIDAAVPLAVPLNYMTLGANITFGGTADLILYGDFDLNAASRTITTNGTVGLFTLFGTISGASRKLVKAGGNRLKLSPTNGNTYTGGTDITAGTLQAAHVTALGTTGTTTLTASGATLQTLTTGGQNGKLTVAALTNSAGGTIKIGG